MSIPEDKDINVDIEKTAEGYVWLTMDGVYVSQPFETYAEADDDAASHGFEYREPGNPEDMLEEFLDTMPERVVDDVNLALSLPN